MLGNPHPCSAVSLVGSFEGHFCPRLGPCLLLSAFAKSFEKLMVRHTPMWWQRHSRIGNRYDDPLTGLYVSQSRVPFARPEAELVAGKAETEDPACLADLEGE